ncbi:MdtA/MuxA family multidrug efflux RND transporter periplasmic adaptor subunit [Pseudomonas luteola]|uniref:MdtA/MuxA family multidrug efflux RND transporter periplasmic adaptor subunit n=1 Tax=Pseudomonas luteola TaxID=47886 RepID=UPI0015E39554|nr:MdtA/MuxA family multidrug efflux RND transporter periplasmic adaptor subunit [Pseudomonas zeshuii]MBA1247458.1 MdtA/MuxA family multidrug efflux RND transporter periplasmic adaptor subunit [Pseudomonas zeshuii]
MSDSLNSKPSRSKFPLLIAVVVVAVGAVAAWHFLGKSPEQADPSGRNAAQTEQKGPAGAGRRGSMAPTDMIVSTGKAEKTTLSVYLNALGTVTAYNTVEVHARVDGQLAKVLFTEGQEVKAGDVLAVVDQRPYQAALAQAQGTLQENQAQLKNAQIDLERYRQLFKEDSVAKQTLDTQQALVAQYQGTIKNSEAQVADARLNLTFTEVRAPISGRLGLRQVDVGNLVASGDTTPIVTITQTKPIALTFSLPEDQLSTVRRQMATGKPLAVEAWDRGRNRVLATGTLVTVDNQIDTSTGTVKFKARFDNQDESLFPNQFVNVRLHALELNGVIVIPISAIQRNDEGPYVFVVGEGNKVATRKVSLGEIQGEQVEVRSGLDAGETVVTEGLDRLRDGQTVKVTQPITETAPKSDPDANEATLGGGAGE